MSIVIVHATQGHGKTSAAAALARRFGCSNIVDEWDGQADLPRSSLALTNVPPDRFRAPQGATVIEFARALRHL